MTANRSFSRLSLMVGGALLLMVVQSTGARRPGASSEELAHARKNGTSQIFETHCRGCHNGSVERAPDATILSMMSADSIYRALTVGLMRNQGTSLSDAEKRSLAQYLAGAPMGGVAAAEVALCPPSPLELNEPPELFNWGLSPGSTRLIPQELARLDRTTVAALRVSWAFAYPGALRARSQPSFAGGLLLTGSQGGQVYAIDYRKHCIRWRFDAAAEVRTGIVVSPWTAGNSAVSHAVFFGDITGYVYAIDLDSGQLIWRVRPEQHANATITGTPSLDSDALYVPISSLEAVTASDPKYACCTFRGSVAALDPRTGAIRWKTYTVEEPATHRGKSGAGVDRWGPSGAPVWSSPMIDSVRNQLVIGTGQNYSSPASAMSDALIALDLKTGRRIWSYQALQGDVFNVACMLKSRENCPSENGPDFDFGAAPVLGRTAAGKPVVVGGQKSGWIYAVEAETGHLIWKSRAGRGGLLGGIHFSIALAGQKIIVPISDAPDGRVYDEPARPGIYALGLGSGATIWRAPSDDRCGGRRDCAPGIPGTITVTPQLILAGGGDAWLRALDIETGKTLWQYDTNIRIRTISGELANGGAISGGAGPILYHGMLVVNSGYGLSQTMPGNLMLVFELPGQQLAN